jgi:hypothetical protein
MGIPAEDLTENDEKPTPAKVETPAVPPTPPVVPTEPVTPPPASV